MADKLTTRVARRLAGKDWPSTPQDEKQTTFGGSLNAEFVDIGRAFFYVETDRQKVYDELNEFDKGSEEFSTALSILADEAVHSEDGAESTFRVEFPAGYTVPASLQFLFDDLAKRSILHRRVMGWARNALKYGDSFLQVEVGNRYGEGVHVSRVVKMPTKMMNRYEDLSGSLRKGNKEGDCAFAQMKDEKPIAFFFPWQIVHMRWMREDDELYGRSLGYTARVSWRKLKAMEEALVINWLTRAFARLLFTVDVTGLTKEQAQKYVDDFKKNFLSKKMQQGDVEKQASTVIKDIFLGRGYLEHGAKFEPALTDVKVLDMSNTGFQTMNPVEHYQRKILIACQVPKAFMGLEKDINAKATLTEQSRRYARTVRRVQSLLSEALTQVYDIELVLHGYDPRTVPYRVVWPNPSRLDESDASTIALTYAKADAVNIDLGIYDNEWVAKNRLKMSDSEWNELQSRVNSQAKEVAANA